MLFRSASDFWLAQEFKTGGHADGYSLDSIQLRMNPGFGTPTGFQVMILDGTDSLAGFLPGKVIGTLVGQDPFAGGDFSFKSMGIQLAPSQYMFLVVTGGAPVSTGSYSWSTAGSRSGGVEGWSILLSRYSSADGVTWNRESRAESFQLAIYATPVPEPSVMALAGLGLGVLWFGRRWRGGATEQEVDKDARQRAIDKSLGGARLPRM